MSVDPSVCRVCGGDLFPEPLLRFEAMPAVAQGFPETAEEAGRLAETLDIYQCSICGLVQLTGDPVSYHREVIRASAYSEEMRRFRRVQFADWVARHGLAGKRVLEIGSGKGEYLELLAEAGLEVCGLEYNRDAVQFCRARDLAVHMGYPSRDAACFPEAPFDAFVSFNFIEHWPDPVGSLKVVAANLSPSALGLIEVPNLDMIFQRGLFSEFIRDHLSYFTEKTLRFTLNLSGFEVLECASLWHDYILSAVVRKRAPLDVTVLVGRRARLMADLQQFVSRFSADGIAVWGAGHQALAVMALTGIAPDIRYIVDSAPFKQGRYSPATQLPIVAPDRLLSDPVRAVIVMAASYSDEVAAILRRDHDPGLVVAILRDHGLEIT